MINLTTFEISLIVLYFLTMLGIGLYYKKSSGDNIESYFLGGRKTPWWMLGFSGSVSNFDIAGSTWIVGMFFFLGFKSFNMFWAFAFLIGAFLMSYLASWIRRTKAMTAAELVKVRFGDGRGGAMARTASALATSAFFLFALGYSFVGVSKFVASISSYDERICATVLIVITGVYVLFGGFKGVILSDVVQALLLNVCGIAVGIAAFALVDVEALHAIVDPSPLPVWSMPELDSPSVPEAYRIYSLFGPFFILFLFKGLLSGASSPGGCYEEQRFLASGSPKEAAVTGAAWGGFLVFRWVMLGGIAFIALTTFKTTGDPEEVLARTIFEVLPGWLRGFLLVGFLSAFMSTFSSTLNGVSSIIVRDIVQPMRPKFGEKKLVNISYLVTLICIVVGLFIGWQSDSIQSIWIWMQLALMPSLLFPNLLRWYWWRMNGWGYAAGVITGLFLATLQYFKQPIFEALGMSDLYQHWTETHIFDLATFPVTGVIVILSCIIVSLMTAPTESKWLINFFELVRPKGIWKAVRLQSKMTKEDIEGPNGLERPRRIILNIILAKCALLSLFLGPLYLIGHWFIYALVCFGIFIASSVALYYTWLRPLGYMDDSSEE